jgi:two-component system NtrC family response regulator
VGRKKILIVEDEIPTLENLKLLLELEGYTVDTATGFYKAKEKLQKYNYAVVLLDLFLDDGNGMDLLSYINPERTKVIVLTAHGTVNTAVEAMKKGAFDFLQKPITFKKLKPLIDKALSSLKSSENNSAEILNKLVGKSEFIQNLKKELPLLAQSQKNILLRGEEGVGKTFVGRLIHHLSPKGDREVYEFNCFGKDEFLLEKELFGSQIPGKESEGILSTAKGSTVLLKRVELLPLQIQEKLATAIERGYFQPIGGKKEIPLEVRFITTTRQNLYEMANQKLFSERLLVLLNEEEKEIPPLRERKEDIMPLLEHFIEEYCLQSGHEKPILSEEVKKFLLTYHWPGNVRELKNLAERLVLLYPGKVVDISDLQLQPQTTKEETIFNIENWRKAKKLFEKEFLKRKLLETGGDVKKVAKMINLDISNVYRKIKEYNLEDYIKRKY